MSMPLKWEFPGSKINSGESAEDCLRRELVEELGVSINVGECTAPPYASLRNIFSYSLPFYLQN